MIVLMQEIVSDATFFELLKTLGPSGAVTTILGYLFMQVRKELKEERDRCDARINDLENKLETSNIQHIESQKETTKEYADLVQKTTRVTADLTTVVRSINSTLERMERKSN